MPKQESVLGFWLLVCCVCFDKCSLSILKYERRVKKRNVAQRFEPRIYILCRFAAHAVRCFFFFLVPLHVDTNLCFVLLLELSNRTIHTFKCFGAFFCWFCFKERIFAPRRRQYGKLERRRSERIGSRM